MKKTLLFLTSILCFLLIAPFLSQAQITSFPYLEDFEGGKAGWVASSPSSDWEFGTPSKSIINSAASGDSAWITKLTGSYSANECSNVQSPVFDLSSLTVPKVRLKVWWNAEFSWDGAQLQSSIDAGTTWQKIGSNGDPFNWYTDGTISGLSSNCIGNGEGWSGRASSSNGSGGWVTAEQEVPGLAMQSSVLFRIVFGSDGSGQDDGFAFDDFEVFQVPQFDIGVTAVTSPASGCLGPAETITVDITNFGTDSVSMFQLGYQIIDPILGNQFPVLETYSGSPIAPGATTSYSFSTTYDFSGPGTYDISAFTILLGDGAAANDGVMTQVLNPVQSPTPANPFFEDFETFSGSSYQNGWAIGGNRSWTADSDGTGSSNTGPENDHTLGTNAGIYMYTEASTTAFSTFELLSPCINLSQLTCPRLEYWYHMYGAAMGELHVDVSPDNGATWDLDVAPVISGQQQTSDIAPWESQSTSLAAYANSTVIIRFRGIIGSTFTSDMAIDDIRVFDGVGEDVALTAISAPRATCGGNAEAITYEITNQGCSTIPAGAVSATFNSVGMPSSGPFVEVIPTTIPVGQTISYTFTGTANLSSAGTYNFSAAVSFTPTSGIADSNLNNNALVDSFVNSTVTAPWSEDFETFAAGIRTNYPNGWTDGGGDFAWESEDGTTGSSSTGPTVDKTLGTSSGIYMYTEASSRQGEFILASPCIDISTFTCPKVKFWYHMYGTNIVSLSLDVSNDGGATWTNDVGIIMGQQQTANADPWDSLVVNMGAFIGDVVKIRFRGSNTGLTADMAIDDVEVYDGVGEDVGITEIFSPVDGCGLGQETVSVEVANFGCSSLSNVPIGFQVGATGTPVIEFVPGPIPVGGSVTYTFTGLANLSAAGTYNLGVAVGLLNDINTSNDSLLLSVTSDFQPNNPTVFSPPVCYNTPAELVATSNGDTILWYDQAVGGLPVALGDTFNTSPLTQTDTFYAAGGSYVQTNLVAPYLAGNGASGNMFDVEATGGSITVDSMYFHNSRTTATDIEIFYKVGTYVGNTANSAVWTSIGRDTIPSNGTGTPSAFPLHLDITIPLGEVYAFHIFSHNGGMQYTNGTNEGDLLVNDNFVTIYQGIGTNSPFPTSFNSPRVWNGTLFYTAVGCESDRVMAVASTHPTIEEIDLGADTTICGSSTLNLDAGNTGFNLTYMWSDGSMTQQIGVSGTPGTADTTTYTVTVSDSLGCSASDDITVIAEEPINVSAAVLNVDCNGNANGGIDITPSGGTGVYTYLWNTGDTIQDLSGLSGGNYSVDVIDSNGCTTPTTVVAVNEPSAALSVTLDASSDVACFGDSTGSLSISTSGGTQPYTYLWSNGDTTKDLTGIPAGSYTGVITDANGCILTSPSLDITEPASAVAIAVDGVGDEDCAGDNSGYIFITPSGGTPPYTYLWSNGSTDPDLTAIPGGDYSGTVTDANGCALTAGPVSIATMDSIPTADFNFVVSGGEATFTNNSSSNANSFAWDFGDGSPAQAGANPVYTYTANGNYTVTLIAYNTCGSDTTTMTLDMGTVSIDDILNTNIQVYPNPTSGNFYIEFNRLFLKDVRIRLANLNGKVISYQELGNVNGALTHQVEVPANLAKGMYLLQVISVDGTLAKRIVLE